MYTIRLYIFEISNSNLNLRSEIVLGLSEPIAVMIQSPSAS